MDHGLRCWKCGQSLADYSLPLRRLEECRACRAELHVCRMCEFYDTGKAKHCRETIAEEVKDKQAANFCDYFRPNPAAYRPEVLSAADQAKAQLDALFGRK
jgi:excinuclease UvrABC nuclease subunit